MSYQYRIGRSCTEWAAGQAWTFGRFTRNVWAELAKEARRLMPDPILIAMDAIEEATKRDAAILRDLAVTDEAESLKARTEGRAPTLLAPLYKPISSDLTERAYNSARRYLSAGSPELSTFMMSHEGSSYLLWQLLLANHPGVTIDQAYDVYWDLATNPVSPGEQGSGRAIDGRMTIEAIISCCNGTSPEPAKNAQSPA